MIKSFFKYLGFLLLGVVFVLGCGYLYLISKQVQQGDVTWHSCYRPSYWSWFVIPPSVKLQCATVVVPVDYDKPDGKTFELALTRLPSQTPNPIGDLLILNGGPGGHSLDMSDTLIADDEYGQRIKDNFNLIGYTPRGIAPASPVISCGQATEDDDAKTYLDACIAEMGTDILPFISSREVIKDLDNIRQKLAQETWSMIGYSYGTKLVANYAKYYPTHLRAGVADGVVDTAESLTTILINHNKQAQATFEDFMEACQEDCPFADKSSQGFIQALKTIENKNLKDAKDNPIDAASLLGVFIENLNNGDNWADLRTMFAQLNENKTDTYKTLTLYSELGNIGFNEDALSLINCADSAPRLSREDYLGFAKQLDGVATFDNLETKSDEEYLDACYHWQWQATDAQDEHLVNDQTPNLLFVSYEHDLATPYANAKTMAQRFDDPLVVILGKHGHTASLFGANACVDQHVSDYLLNPKMDFGKKLLMC
ncbi:alpha/beta fold hydrolase [Moraxella sp. ZY200743]|uniref:alpha/beta fold hydrolase n=1 Tax=Moraxella sp. ZY200743 TaxID=2911970 RepID=UPI003D7F17D6